MKTSDDNYFLIVEMDKRIFIESIYQFHTYRGLFSGMPNERINKQILEYSYRKATEDSFCGKAHMLYPKQTAIPIKDERTYKETPMALPDITCIAELRYYKPLTNPDRFMSCMCVVWFQDNYAFPIQDNVLQQFLNLRWSSVAIDYIP
jgi:hypothetical protein